MGDNSYYAPVSPIEFDFRFMVKFDRLKRFMKGDNND